MHIFTVFGFVKGTALGFTGVCISTLLMFALRLAIVLFYVEAKTKLKNIYNVKLFSKESTQQISYQFKTGLYGLLMGVWSWWAFDVYTLIASYLSVSEISAQTVLRTLGLITFMVPVGIQIGC